MSDATSGLDPVRMARLQARFASALAQGVSVALWAEVMPQASAVWSASGERTFAQLNAGCNQRVRALRRRELAAELIAHCRARLARF